MLFNLLTSAAESTAADSSATGGNKTQSIIMWVILGVVLVGLIVMNFLSNKKRRAQMEAEKEKRNAIKPGFKVMTIGGIVGTVVAVDDDANTFVLQTGTDEEPNYIKFDKVAIYSSEDPNEHTEDAESDHNEEEQPAPADNSEANSVDVGDDKSDNE